MGCVAKTFEGQSFPLNQRSLCSHSENLSYEFYSSLNISDWHQAILPRWLGSL